MVTSDSISTRFEMMPINRRHLLAIAASAMAASSARATEKPVIVFAAASLRTALDAIAGAWQLETGKRVVCSFAGSAALARQVDQGAPTDILATADVQWMDWAAQRRLIRLASRKDLLGNTLVLIAASNDDIALRIEPGFALAAALGTSRLAIGDPQSVPAGQYGKQALTALGVYDQVSTRLASTENVRAALAFVARGEARLGIVYATDAKAEPRVRIVDRFPAGSHAPIIYPFALTAASTHPDASAFLSYLSSSAARKVFVAEGFTVQ